MKHIPEYNAGIPKANFHKMRMQITKSKAAVYSRFLKMYHSLQKELESLFKASQIKIWPNLSSWTWLQRPDLRFKDLYHNHFFFIYIL